MQVVLDPQFMVRFSVLSVDFTFTLYVASLRGMGSQERVMLSCEVGVATRFWALGVSMMEGAFL